MWGHALRRLVAGILMVTLPFALSVYAQGQRASSADSHGNSRHYSAGEGPTDPTAVHQVIDALGVGKKVDLTPRSEKRMRVVIERIELDRFRIRKGKVVRELRYEDVATVKAAFPMAAKIAIWSAVGVGVYVAVLGLLAARLAE